MDSRKDSLPLGIEPYAELIKKDSVSGNGSNRSKTWFVNVMDV